MKQLLIATHNQGKVEEFRQMFAGMGLEIKSAADFDLPEPEETEKTFEGNALLKARAVNDEVGGIDGTQSAYFIAVLALVYPDGREELFEGKMLGALTWPMRGDHGHGLDC